MLHRPNPDESLDLNKACRHDAPKQRLACEYVVLAGRQAVVVAGLIHDPEIDQLAEAPHRRHTDHRWTVLVPCDCLTQQVFARVVNAS